MANHLQLVYQIDENKFVTAKSSLFVKHTCTQKVICINILDSFNQYKKINFLYFILLLTQ